jgi:hypothetical protein
MRRRANRLMLVVLSGAGFFTACGGESPSPEGAKEPFVARGKLKSEAAAKEALSKVGKTVPAR